MKIIKLFSISLTLVVSIYGQGGGPYEITQSVIANGGGISDGGTYSISGTIAQHGAGLSANGTPYRFLSGFWTEFLAPTAAEVSISGRVVESGGRPISFAVVSLSDGTNVVVSSRANKLGYFLIDGVEVGRTYILSVSARSKLYLFVPRLVTVDDELSDLELVGIPR